MHQRDDVEEPSQYHLISVFDVEFRSSEIAGLSPLTTDPCLAVVWSLFPDQPIFFLSTSEVYSYIIASK